MRRIPGRFDVEREFSREDRLVDFPIPPPPPAVAPDAIYTSPGPILGPKVVLPKPPPELRRMIGWPPPKVPILPEYAITPKPIGRAYPLPALKVKGPTIPPVKNFLDRFFDWLNKILS
ncbi:hypothetical protein ES703_16573 [subsurface metagenome]